MKTPTSIRPPAPPTPLARRAAGPATAILLAAGLFLAGRWTAPEAPAEAPERAPSEPLAPTEAPAQASAPSAAPAPPPPAPERAAARLAERPSANPALVGQAAAEARVQLESVRPALLSRCWPAEGLGQGRDKARLTFHLTFDAAGREVARGISEDRTAPAGAFARCLRTLPIGTLAIPAPGARVGVRVAMSFP